MVIKTKDSVKRHLILRRIVHERGEDLQPEAPASKARKRRRPINLPKVDAASAAACMIIKVLI